MADLPDVCVVTHPLAVAGENATRTLLDLLSAVSGVCLVTADLPADSSIRERYEVVELTTAGAGTGVVVPSMRFLRNQLRMCRAIYRRNEEVVLFFGATAYVLPVLVAKLLGRTVVVEPRGDVPLTLRIQWERRFPGVVARSLAGGVRVLERLSFGLADAIVTYTPGMADQLDLGPFESKLFTDGARFVDTERFRPAVPFDERERVVGYVGRLDEEKGVRLLAEVAAALPTDVTFRFVGDGPLRGWLEEQLADEMEDDRVEIRGWVEHERVPDELNALRLLVLPSSPTEGLPTTILEALACGTPVYATPVAGVPDVVQEGQTGFLIDDHRVEVISAEVTRILDEEDLPVIGDNGRALVEATYSFDAAVERYRRILGMVAS